MFEAVLVVLVLLGSKLTYGVVLWRGLVGMLSIMLLYVVCAGLAWIFGSDNEIIELMVESPSGMDIINAVGMVGYICAYLFAGYFFAGCVTCDGRESRALGLAEMPFGIEVSQRVISLLLVFVFVIYFLGGEWRGVIWRGSYLPESTTSFAVLGSFFLLVSTLFLGFLNSRFARRALFLLIFIVMLSKATKVAAAVPLLYLVSRSLSEGRYPGSKKLTFFCVLSYVTFCLVLYFRGYDEHGVVSYLDLSKLVDSNYGGLDLLGPVHIFASGFYIFSETLGEPMYLFTMEYMLEVFDPRPGFMTNWYAVADLYRIHSFIPYSGFAEIINFGWGVGALFFVVLGCVLRVLLGQLERAYYKRQYIILLFLLISFALIHVLVVSGFAYNARSIVRLLYYTLFFMVLSYVVDVVFYKKIRFSI